MRPDALSHPEALPMRRHGHARGALPRAAASSSGPAPAAMAEFPHTPVLLEPVLALAPAAPALIVDATLGGGGHAEALLRRYPAAELFGCDRDPAAVTAASERLAPFSGRTLLKPLRFSELSRHVLQGSVDFLLADLGVSSPQLDRPERGFSFSQDGPLDMRMDPAAQHGTAADLVNKARPERLQDIFFRLGEERFAPRIARAIAAERATAPITSTARLAALVAGAVPARFHRKGHHPATKTFQALRMAVNDELGELERLLEVALGLLRPGGRVAVIAFHSLEDRLVKNAFRRWERPCDCPPELPVCVCGKVPAGVRLTKKPVQASSEEAARNPRSRSAKLRAFEKR